MGRVGRMRRSVLVAVSGAVLVPALPVAAAPAYGSYARPVISTLVSVRDDGAQVDRGSYFASVSDDGGVVAFSSSAWDLVDAAVGEQDDIYVRDVARGRIEVVSQGVGGAPADGGSLQANVSGDGRTVVFVSYATNLVDDVVADGRSAQVYARDLTTGRTTLVSRALDGGAADAGALQPKVSDDGRYVVWHSGASNLVEDDTNGALDIFVADRQSGAIRRVSVAADGTQSDGTSAFPQISGDGSTVAFSSAATTLVPDDTNGVRDLFVVTLATGEVERVSVASDGTEANFDSTFSALSQDGSVVAFQSGASNLVPSDTNGMVRALDGFDVFVRDRAAGRTERVSVSSTGAELGESMSPSISADGRYVAFQSIRPDEDPASFTAIDDAFVHDRVTRATERITSTPKGNLPSGGSANPMLVADGSAVVLQSDAPDLVPGDGNEVMDVFLVRRGGEAEVLSLGTDGFMGRRISGTAALSGVVLAAGTDGEDPSAPLGADLRAADVIYRPEDADYLVSIRLDHLPHLSPSVSVPGVYSSAGLPEQTLPGLTYVLGFALDGVPYELRSSRLGDVTTPVTDAGGATNPSPTFGLYRCASTCARVASPEGGVGTAGDEIRMDLPLSSLGLEPGEVLTDLRVLVGLGEGAVGTAQPLDEIALGDVTMPAVTFQIGVGSTVLDAGGSAGRFAVELPSAPASGQRLVGRACLADRCAERVMVAP